MESSRIALFKRSGTKKWKKKYTLQKNSPPTESDSPTKKATTPTKKATPTKKVTVTPTKNATLTKKVTPTKSMSEWIVPPSPRSLDLLYKTLREDHNNLKVEIKELFSRMASFADDDIMRELLLENYPLTKLYDSFLTMEKHGEKEGTSNRVPLIVIPDSSTSNV
ncbi:hypothetical protein C2S53_004215 [Perilla frutescens var. hirtella]|uniref:Uncharacterized protein n=1 Tax=Perilla frutescens var. hirtella TaxID=608512 RepID=A0AAD4JK24_PERFH|nr:hypothetical protein C2S53_004215 [Perilla frutescens var. hirtella]